ncbi:capsule biosynthesis protein [Roseovarius sp. A21]|uniref:Capsule biosynthesis protein n=1 Tax=Roseovarius bejariae TaxID=2576383 RepID=A0A844CNT0_9RHOB|nr:capsule biosynthesis protein [Roseovarius bejariae]MRU15125.1 capsule biosynthesis protein [Roseovarius bejariae]
MTTKPKARKFRIRRNAPAANDPSAQQAKPAEPAQPQAPEAQSASHVHTAQPHEGEISSAREMASAQSIDEIRKEGLTGRQLRMARRMAQKYGLAPTSDFDAVRLLRAKGIDPFQRANILELVAPGGGGSGGSGDGTSQPNAMPEGGDPKVQLPQTVPAGQQNLPATEQLSPADRRAYEIQEIQRDIAKRRRRRLLLLLTRLSAFVFLPTLIAGYYFYAVATPMYSTKSEFLILTADGSGASGAASSLFSGTTFATGQDSIATQSYLGSKDAMLRLDQDVGFREHFSQDWIDPLQRLDPDASNEAAYKLYKKYVKLGYDPTEGVIRMELSTADPETSARFSEKLLDYAEERVDHLSQEKRQDAVKTAVASLEDAKTERRAAQERLVKLQEGTILDPEGEIASIRSLINSVELQLQEKQLALNTQLNNQRPNRAKVAALESEIEVLTNELNRQEARLNQATEGSASLAAQAAEIQMAQADLATADMVLQSALESKRQSEIEANKQVRYLTVSVKPVASQDPSYPRSFENTLLAFLIFSGIYLMISLTVSILREQVSS